MSPKSSHILGHHSPSLSMVDRDWRFQRRGLLSLRDPRIRLLPLLHCFVLVIIYKFTNLQEEKGQIGAIYIRK